jgi:ribosomal-protein-alanine N-acetyltransferase
MPIEGRTILETERLLLRELTHGDLDALTVLYRDPGVRRYFPEGTLTREETLEELEWIIGEYYAKHGFGLWATVHKPSRAFIGRCGLLPWVIDGRPEVEVAYMLAKEYWGRGLATEAARAIARHAFDTLPVSRLICVIDADNAALRRVAEKIGMTLYRDDFEDDKGPAHLYTMPRPETKP